MLGDTARFAPSLWVRFPTKYGIDTPSTPNGCESFHKLLKPHVGVRHPNLYKFSAVLLERQELTYPVHVHKAAIHCSHVLIWLKWVLRGNTVSSLVSAPGRLDRECEKVVGGANKKGGRLETLLLAPPPSPKILVCRKIFISFFLM